MSETMRKLSVSYLVQRGEKLTDEQKMNTDLVFDLANTRFRLRRLNNELDDIDRNFKRHMDIAIKRNLPFPPLTSRGGKRKTKRKHPSHKKTSLKKKSPKHKYTITKYTRNKARKLGVTVKNSTNPKKKVDVFKDGVKIASVGAIGYGDYPTFMKEKGKLLADGHRNSYKMRHERYRHRVGSNSYYADQLLW